MPTEMIALMQVTGIPDSTDVLVWFGGVLVTAAVGGLVGGGTLLAVGYRALRSKVEEDLRETFVQNAGFRDRVISEAQGVYAKASDLTAWSARVNGLETVLIQARDRGDANSDAIIRLQESEQHRWEPVMRTIEKLDKRQGRHEQALSRVATLLDELEKRVNRTGG